MRRIMIMGISPGVGKSTFARSLGKILNINVYHLDTLYWKPNWIAASFEEFSQSHQELVNQSQWIIEGNYNNTVKVRAEHADTIIYLELPLYVCLYRVIKRWIMNIGKTRPDMGKGCKEKIDWNFIKFIYTTYYPRKQKMFERLQALQTLGSKKNIIILKSQRDINLYLKTIQHQEKNNKRYKV
ncbi:MULTISPECIES: topology modulation protein [Bacillus]|uniref:topology modulation protein n=1 Tax=Bacillus TaxID=1386 RepID=UPI00077A6D9E|nr:MULTISPECIES: topology modulation protein [Bacillus cereus group]KXY72242.1 topology modulation protein [Bacillus cereus]MBG9938049.1 topology modulation protein [Bacillus tropicus]MED2996733.1 topology modulation protein [Bacillus tropicus]OTY53260.1 topology modulation protein [Bacillus thuringiensis serovar graciosensis]